MCFYTQGARDIRTSSFTKFFSLTSLLPPLFHCSGDISGNLWCAWSSTDGLTLGTRRNWTVYHCLTYTFLVYCGWQIETLACESLYQILCSPVHQCPRTRSNNRQWIGNLGHWIWTGLLQLSPREGLVFRKEWVFPKTDVCQMHSRRHTFQWSSSHWCSSQANRCTLWLETDCWSFQCVHNELGSPSGAEET